MIILIDQIKAQLSKMVSIDKRSRLAFSGSSPFILRLTVFEIGSPTCNTQPSSSLSPSSKGWSFPHDDDDDDFDGVQPCWLLCRCNLRGPEGQPSKGPGTHCAKPLPWGSSYYYHSSTHHHHIVPPLKHHPTQQYQHHPNLEFLPSPDRALEH